MKAKLFIQNASYGVSHEVKPCPPQKGQQKRYGDPGQAQARQPPGRRAESCCEGGVGHRLGGRATAAAHSASATRWAKP